MVYNFWSCFISKMPYKKIKFRMKKNMENWVRRGKDIRFGCTEARQSTFHGLELPHTQSDKT